jgi:hypothetical protein
MDRPPLEALDGTLGILESPIDTVSHGIIDVDKHRAHRHLQLGAWSTPHDPDGGLAIRLHRNPKRLSPDPGQASKLQLRRHQTTTT